MMHSVQFWQKSGKKFQINEFRLNKYVLDVKKPQKAYFCIKNQVNAKFMKKILKVFILIDFCPLKSKEKNKVEKIWYKKFKFQRILA